MEGSMIKYELTLGAKVPGRSQFAIANSEVKAYITEDEEFDKVLDDLQAKLTEAISAALLVTAEASER